MSVGSFVKEALASLTRTEILIIDSIQTRIFIFSQFQGNRIFFSVITLIILSAIQNGETEGNVWANQLSGTHY